MRHEIQDVFLKTHSDQLKEKLITEAFVLELFKYQIFDLFLDRADGFRGSLLVQSCRALCNLLGLCTERNEKRWRTIMTGEVVEELLLLASENPYAACVLGYAHLFGIRGKSDFTWIVYQSDEEAMKWLKNAADHGIALAAGPVARAYERGDHGLKKNYVEAASYYIKTLLEQDEFRATLLAGQTKECSDQEYAWLLEWAQQGDPVAIRTLGYFMLDGYRTERSIIKGLEEIQKAAEREDLIAMCFAACVNCFGMKFEGYPSCIRANEFSFIRGAAMAQRALDLGWEPARQLLAKINGGTSVG